MKSLSQLFPQSVLGPLLFLLYVDELNKVIHHSTIKLFADDIALYREIISPHDQSLLQEDLTSIYEWCQLWQLNLNPVKCEYLCISYKHHPLTHDYTLAGQTIPLKPVVRYLGVFINSHLKWDHHVRHLTAKATRSLNYLRHTLFSCPSHVKAVAYKCLVRPILEYASPVWCVHSSKDISQLESIQRRAARWVCGSRWNSATRNWTKSSDSCLHQLKWPTLHSRRSFSSISLAHDILHNRISIPFNKYFQFSFTNTRSHPQSLSIPSSTINPYRHSFFVNTPFLWNSIPPSILQLSNRVAFHSALCRFLFV